MDLVEGLSKLGKAGEILELHQYILNLAQGEHVSELKIHL